MAKHTIRIGVLAELRPPVTRWGKPALRPIAILPAEPATPPHTRLTTIDGVETWYLGARDLLFHSGDTGHHLDNLNGAHPSVWVALRGTEPGAAELVAVTVDPYEGEGLAGDLALTVEAVPMPAPIAAELAAFVQAHHVEVPFKKRKRSPQDPNAAAAPAPRILPGDQGWIARQGRTGEDGGRG
ncbi:DUF3305 domain-containing protein [Rhodovulum strictum]|uniref:DUF3305 domain-containing protein n=1 Tax=Rhodovulum strictum TaxID=58314 RepID=A0A844BHA8_9RHOB|nr:DUF3305 domain-containing protein [Rhodovulum strictum]MRH21969.1 DUF3305 domain-containing protein [Rhodovulum strictum]